MSDLASLQQQLDTLRDHRAKGVQSLSVAGESVTYKTDEQMSAVIFDLEQRIAAITGRRVGVVRFASSKGV